MEMTKERRLGLNGFTLKCLAMLTMLIDHTGMALFPQFTWLRVIGRLAFPIYCFLLAEGAIHTKSHGKYLLRLFMFALISEVPFDLARLSVDLLQPGDMAWKIQISMANQNVFFTLFLGLLGITAIQKLPNRILAAVGAVLCILVASPLHTDYGSGGVIIILIFYLFREYVIRKAVLFAIFNIGLWGNIKLGLFYVLQSVQSYAVFALVPILCYNGKRGPGLKYIFYVFYPVHLLVLYWLRFHVFT